ncbi:MarR family transcriptional regulator [Streptomyces marokkonensis]|uniref:MarR family transcriptional regulator n=1 Tax=Streptomyces marokkonensis TaxID=324855 RepID=A0ABP7SVX5_9ACTN
METGYELRFDRGGETPERLKGQLSRLVGMTAAQTRRVAGDALQAVGAHKDHFVVLAALSEFGPASQAALSGRTRIYKSDLVSVLNDLADGGWVRRAPDPADKRRNVITITNNGECRLDELSRVLDGVNEHIMAPLGRDERAQLFALLDRINAHLDDGPDHQPRTSTFSNTA